MLGAIVGDRTLPVVAATLDGFALHADPGGVRMGLVAAVGARTRGGVAEVAPEVAERLEFALTGLGGASPLGVVVAGRMVEAFVSRQAFGAPWPEVPEIEWRAHLAEAASEAMSYLGSKDVDEIRGLLQGISYRALGRVRGAADGAPVRARRGYGTADVAQVALARPYARYFSIEEHRLRHRRFDGGMSGVVARAVFVSGDAVTVLPFDPRRRLVLLIEQFRIGPVARRDPHPWQLEAVAGRCDVGETPEATARREAREEAAIELGRVARIAGYYTSPGIMAEHITAFVGEADLGDAGGVHGLAEEDEDIRVIVTPLSEALELVAIGEVGNAPLLLSLLWLGGQADRLVEMWTG